MTEATKYNQDTVARIVEALRRGNTRRNAAAAAHISARTFSEWLSAYDEFEQAVFEAEQTAVRYMNDVVLLAASKGNWYAAMTWLERRYPLEYGRVDRLTALQIEEIERIHAELTRQGIEATQGEVLKEYTNIAMGQRALPSGKRRLKSG
jgi:hypothetical protein